MPNAVASPIPPTAKKVVKAKKPSVAATHAPVANMVNEALVALKDKKGSSLVAIKKYIDANNETVNSAKLAPFIKRYLKSAVLAGKLVQTKGIGATGSFKMGMVDKPEKKVKKATPTVKTPINTAKKVKTPKKIARKVKTPKKVVKKPIAKKSRTPKTAAARKPIAKAKKSANKTDTKK